MFKYLMRKSVLSIKKKYTDEDISSIESSGNNKSTNINVLLNRVRLDKKNESRKKLLFSVVTSLGLILFGVLVF